MPKVPVNPNPPSPSSPLALIDPTYLLMAASTMQQLGRFAATSRIRATGGLSTPTEDPKDIKAVTKDYKEKGDMLSVIATGGLSAPIAERRMKERKQEDD